MSTIKRLYKKYAILILIVLIFSLAFTITARAAFAKGYSRGIEETELKYEIAAKNEALKLVAEAEKEDKPSKNKEAEAVARVLYGLSDYQLSDTAKMAVIEVIMSRAKCSYGEFGDDILSVCNKDSQWQGYVKDGPYIQADYELADKVLNDISRARITPEGCLFASISNGSVSVRKEWNSKNVWNVT